MVRSLIPVFLTIASLGVANFALANESKLTKGFYSYDANMWEVYKPTPLTLKWLKEEGYVD
jgi:hypothetical protein